MDTCHVALQAAVQEECAAARKASASMSAQLTELQERQAGIEQQVEA